MVWLVPRGHRPNMCEACSWNLGGPLVGLRRSCGVLVCAILPRGVGFTRIGEEERRDGEATALHKTHIWAKAQNLKDKMACKRS